MAGSSDYPTSVDNKTQLQDGVDYIEADNVNNAYVPINKTQTFIGANGKGASWSSDILDHLANYGTPPLVSKASASTLSVSAGAVVLKNSSQSNRLIRRTTSSITVSASDLDTGAMAVGYYYVYAVGDSAATTFTVKFSTSATTPTGITNFLLIGWFYNETAGVLDVTSNYVGNTKRPGVRNILTIEDTTDTSATGDTSFHNATPAAIRFYAPSRKIEARMVAQFYAAGASQWGAFTWSIDASDNATSTVFSTAGASAGLTGTAYGLPIMYVGAIAADTCTLIPRLKCGDGSYTIHMHKKFIFIEEL